MSRVAVVQPEHAERIRYRLIQYGNGEWSLLRDGVERCRWSAAWPAAAIPRIVEQAVRAEVRCPVVWRRMAFAGRPVVHLLVAAPGGRTRPRRSARSGPAGNGLTGCRPAR